MNWIRTDIGNWYNLRHVHRMSVIQWNEFYKISLKIPVYSGTDEECEEILEYRIEEFETREEAQQYLDELMEKVKNANNG